MLGSQTFDMTSSFRYQAHPYRNSVADVISYNYTACLVFLIYDIILTLDQEVAVIWPMPWNWMKFLYAFVRYYPVPLQISKMFLRNSSFAYTPRECHNWIIYEAISILSVVMAVDYVLILRIFAMYRESRGIQFLVGSLYIVDLVAMSLGISLGMPKLTFDNLCITIKSPRALLLFSAPAVLFQTTLFGLTAWKFSQAVKSGWGDVPIVQLLMRDGTWGFFVLFALLIAGTILFACTSQVYTDVLSGWWISAFAFCGYRIVLNLNCLNLSTELSAVSSSGDIVFTSHLEVGSVAPEIQGSRQAV